MRLMAIASCPRCGSNQVIVEHSLSHCIVCCEAWPYIEVVL